MSLYFHAYGYNAPGAEHFENTYYPFYKIIREKNPELPIVMMSLTSRPELRPPRAAQNVMKYREITEKAYARAIAEGDKNVYYIDGLTLLPNSEATVDCVHPTDLGFCGMAEKIYPLLKEILFGEKASADQNL